MLNSPNSEKDTFGFIANGREFVFIKLSRQDPPKYSRSYALSLDREQEFYTVLSILKRLEQLASSN